MDNADTQWMFAAPLILVGVLTLAFSWRGAARYLAATHVQGWARWWSAAMLLPAMGVLMVAIGLLLGLGLWTAALGLMYAAAGVAVVAGAVGAVRALRAGERQRAAWAAATPLFLLVAFALIALSWDTAWQVLTAVTGGGLLVFSVGLAHRRWRAVDAHGRRDLLQSVALAVGLSSEAASQLLSAHVRTLGWVLEGIGVASLLVALGLILAARRRRPSSSAPGHRPMS